MATVQLGLKIEEGIKSRIDSLVHDGRYRHVSDFLHRAIAAELERAETGFTAAAKEQLITALRSDPEVRMVLFDAIRQERGPE